MDAKSFLKDEYSLLDTAARLIGLNGPSPEFKKALQAQLSPWLSSFGGYKRHSRQRKETLRIANDASDASRSLRKLKAALTSINPHPPSFKKFLRLIELDTLEDVIAQIDRLSRSAERQAASLPKDKGGKSKMVEFADLIARLGVVYEQFQHRRAAVTWREDRGRFEGKFVQFVDILVLHAAIFLKEHGYVLKFSQSEKARASYIHRATLRMNRRARQAR